MQLLDLGKDSSQLRNFIRAHLLLQLDLQEGLSCFLQFEGLKEVLL